MPQTALLHGYTGRWDGYMKFKKWRGTAVRHSSTVAADLQLDLVVPTSGSNGSGAIHGRLSAELKDRSTGRHTYSAEIDVMTSVVFPWLPPGDVGAPVTPGEPRRLAMRQRPSVVVGT